jgi:hypothetical protein
MYYCRLGATFARSQTNQPKILFITHRRIEYYDAQQHRLNIMVMGVTTYYDTIYHLLSNLILKNKHVQDDIFTMVINL